MPKDDYLEWSEKKQMGFLSHKGKVRTDAASFSCDRRHGAHSPPDRFSAALCWFL